ncbi:hypothetical protein [Psychromonas sp. SP041]|uniref:hypothetical protein n=1 Tax=Psychromonas sp. SP041 TaxID=1365007 RepID=UPI0010C7861D|nr:hypothetical protein [Psychromonas sp. SP041]
MIKIIEQDSNWSHAIVEFDDQKYLMSPPYVSGKKIKHSTESKQYLATFKSPEDAQRYMMTVFASDNLESIMAIWKKYSSSGMGAINLSKMAEMAIKNAQSDFNIGVFPERELVELHTLHVGFGLSDGCNRKVAELIRKNAELYPEEMSSFSLKMSRKPACYSDRQADILDYAGRMLRISDNPRKSLYILMSFSLHINIEPRFKDRFDALLTKAKKEETKFAIKNGESLAKPWQKYVGSTPNMKMNAYNKHGVSQGDQTKKSSTS